MTLRRVTLLVGSPRLRGTSTSEALGRYLLRRLRRDGVTSDVLYLATLRGPRVEAWVAPVVAASDLVVLSSPVYVDALPATVTAALERLAAARALWAHRDPVRFVALVNCGFPEPLHTRTPLDICHAFADAAGLAWAGGLGLGGGEALHGAPLERAGRMASRVRRALELAADALLAGGHVPDESVALLSAPLVPPRLYTLLGNLRWLYDARRHRAVRRLWDRPYGE
jgi:hypothetical protein